MRKFSALVTVAAACVANQASAFVNMDMSDIKPYLGVDVHWRHLEVPRDIGRNKKDVVEGNPYLGIRICDWIGVEGGYEFTGRNQKRASLATGDSALTFPLIAPEEHLTNWKLEGGYLSLLGFYTPCILENDCTQIFGGVGVSHKRLTYTDNLVSINGDPIGFDGRLTFKKSKTFLRLTAGLQHMITCNIGVRGTVTWENTNQFKNLINEQAALLSRLTLKNSVALGLGVFYSF